MDTMYDTGYDDGKKAALRELAPLVDAIKETIFMFKDIEKSRNIPSVWQQYVAMGKQLERLLTLSELGSHMETAYELGYKDGKQDAEVQHKNHVMRVLKREGN